MGVIKSTAEAVRRLSASKPWKVDIGHEIAAQEGRATLARSIHDIPWNTTRFLVISSFPMSEELTGARKLLFVYKYLTELML